MNTEIKTDTETTNKIIVQLLTEIFSNQNVILDRLASLEAQNSDQTKEEIQECYSKARNVAREVIQEHLFEHFGPDISEEITKEPNTYTHYLRKQQEGK